MPCPDKPGFVMTALLVVIARSGVTKQSLVVYRIRIAARRNGKGAGFPAPFGFIAFALLLGFSLLINRATSFVEVG